MSRRGRSSSSHGVEGLVTVHSMGGLGNQLFIYAAGLAAARNAGGGLRIDSSLHRHDPDRSFLLADLGFPAEYVDLRPPAPSRRRREAREAPHGCSYREPSFRYDSSAVRTPLASCMFGYFQSWQYLEPIADELREQFSRLVRQREESAAFREVEALVSRPGAVVLHVRRGDYLRAHALTYHGLAGIDFYGRAADVLRRMGFDGPLVVFSDDVAAARADLAELGDIDVVAGDGLDAVDEMLLMSRAQALVTANSSFSWWAAWIGAEDGRPVICPRPWFDDPATDSRDLLMPDWLTLQR